ncbi:hypothetical protein IWW57_003046 [Coemansia sp. S610]|nr:hypothetical protein IWW57_003046 [Coemansia sp. S610]KAJ2700091.1 hypothetical protein H4218_002261 [Coemansia sp. IMI 209128]
MVNIDIPIQPPMSRSPSPCPSDSSCDTQYTNSLVHLTVSFPELPRRHEDHDYECFGIDPLGDTIEEVVEMIAKRLGLVPTEFFFKGRGKRSCYEFKANTPFAEVFYSEKSIERIRNHDLIKPLRIKLYDNPAFVGKGVLRWAIERELAGHFFPDLCDEYNGDGRLDERFEFHIEALKALNIVPATTPVASVGELLEALAEIEGVAAEPLGVPVAALVASESELNDTPVETADVQTEPQASEDSKPQDVPVESVDIQIVPQASKESKSEDLPIESVDIQVKPQASEDRAGAA